MRLDLRLSSPSKAGPRAVLTDIRTKSHVPWSNQSGGGGWKGGGGGTWGPRPGGPGRQPDLEEILRRSQALRQAMPGRAMGGPLGADWRGAGRLIGFFGFTVRVNPESSASFCGSANMSASSRLA